MAVEYAACYSTVIARFVGAAFELTVVAFVLVLVAVALSFAGFGMIGSCSCSYYSLVVVVLGDVYCLLVPLVYFGLLLGHLPGLGHCYLFHFFRFGSC